MNILEQEDLIKSTPDNILFMEAQAPSGQVPQYLVVSELQRRADVRQRYAERTDEPDNTVAGRIVADAAPRQGIAGLSPEPPTAASMAGSSQMVAAGGGRMPYRRMAGGGMVPPNSLVEDASKFNPQTLYDMDASQIGMASPTNMGIASVLPMADGGIVRMEEGREVPESEWRYPDWARDYIFDPSNPVDIAAVVGGAALMPAVGAIPGFLANVGRKGIMNLGKFGIRKLNQQFIDKKGRLVPAGGIRLVPGSAYYDTGIGMLRNARNYINPRAGEFWKRTVPAAAVGNAVRSKLGNVGRDLGNVGGDLGNVGGDVVRSATASQAGDEVPDNSAQSAINFLETKGYAFGGIVRMNQGSQIPGKEILGKRLYEYYQDNPNEEVDSDHVQYIQAFHNKVDVAPSLTDYENDASNLQLLADNFEGFDSYKNLVTKVKDDNDQFSLAKALSLTEAPSLTGAPSLTVTEAVGTERKQDDLGLTNYKTSEQIRNLDTSNQIDALLSQIENLEKLKGQTSDTFDITESVLRSEERADERATNQALINLGAGIARGDISGGFKDAGTAVSDERQSQEAFRQSAEIRKAEAESQAGSDMMTRDIGIISSQISALGDISAQNRASAEILLARENNLIAATESGNAKLIAQAAHNLEIAKYATQISQFNQTLRASINESASKDERERLRFQQAVISKLGSTALLEGGKLTQLQKDSWIPNNLRDKTPGWTPARVLNDILAGLDYGTSQYDQQYVVDTVDPTAGFSVVGSGAGTGQ